MEISCSDLGPGFEKIVKDAIEDVQPVADAGIALAVIKNKQLCFAGGFGLRDRGAGRKVDADTCFAIGSATKAFTSMAISMYADQNQIDLEVPIRKYLPDFAMKDAQATAEMTLLDILCHRTGLPRHDSLWYLGPFTRSQLFYRLKYLDPIQGAFRNAFLYNNMMYMVAGYLLESISGFCWEDIVQTQILDRLGMTASSFKLNDIQQLFNHAKGYEKQDEVPLKDFTNIGPAAEINSTAIDLAKWIQMFLSNGALPGGGNPIIGRASLERMYTGLNSVGNGVSYGLGWFVDTVRDQRFVYHQGDADGNTAYVSFMPDAGLGVIALTNQHSTPDLIGKWPDKVTARIYDYLLHGTVTNNLTLPARMDRSVPAGPAAPATHAPDAAPASGAAASGDYTGMFCEPGYGDMSISRAGRELEISYYGSTWPLHQLSDTKFYFKLHAFGTDFVLPVVFHRDGNGMVDSLFIPLTQLPTAPIQFTKR